jgi:hypothetical protein
LFSIGDGEGGLVNISQEENDYEINNEITSTRYCIMYNESVASSCEIKCMKGNSRENIEKVDNNNTCKGK